MFKEHPKGLIVAFFANMGERFGFYTMMAILVLFLQAKYGLNSDRAGAIYSVFYFLIYALALVGGIIADKTRNYKGTIQVGIITMFIGYVLLAIPGMGLPFALLGLFTIALGNGLFKGNLQAVVGQMYDDPKYSKLRDSAFSLFYMGINIGAVFAPNAARLVRNWFLGQHGLKYDADLPALCHRYLNSLGDVSAPAQAFTPPDGNVLVLQGFADTVNAAPVGDLATFVPERMSALMTPVPGIGQRLQEVAAKVTSTGVENLEEFARNYLDVFSTGYNLAFGIAAVAMVISLVTFLVFKRLLPDRKSSVATSGSAEAMPWDVEKKRLMALGLVFLVVIFFWMSFHQNGLTLTFYARDYIAKGVDPLNYLVFDIRGLLLIAGMILGVVYAIRKGKTLNRVLGAACAVASAALMFLLFRSYEPAAAGTDLAGKMPLEPEIFQQFNPYFVVFLTPVVVGLFTWLRSRGKEPSTPHKIGIGMILAATGFVLLAISSIGLIPPVDLNGSPTPDRVSPNWLISTYFVLTVAELFLSPMGLSFVSKVAPPRFQGLMQGGWLGATAIGNQLLVVGAIAWGRLDLWMVWGLFIVCCLISATVIFSMSKWLNAMTSAGTAQPQPAPASAGKSGSES